MGIILADDLILEFEGRGFHYNKDLLYNYYLSLITKPFVILSGISGSGKSKIAELFAEITNKNAGKNYEMIPVKPNWRDGKGLFGYHNMIDDSYYITPLIRLFLRALADSENPYYLILDEMNIARPEHYFADYLSLIESRRTVESPLPTNVAELAKLVKYDSNFTLSEAIVLAAFDINKPNQSLKVEDYRNNRFSELWKNQFGAGANNWTAQFRSELNQGNGRFAHRVFSGGNGVYVMKDMSSMQPQDAQHVTALKTYYDSLRNYEVVQDNIVLHNESVCIGANGTKCQCQTCPYRNDQKYKCDKLYNSATEEYLVPPEIPIPLNVFTVGTVNVDETTFMFSPKVMDRSNIIEFNEVDFDGAYSLSAAQKNVLQSSNSLIQNDQYFFDAGINFPDIKISIPDSGVTDNFNAKSPDEFTLLLEIFSALKRRNMHFGYRVMNEISQYMINALEYNTTYSDCAKVAMDKQIMQKILPKIYGSFDAIWNPLVAILGKLVDPSNDWAFDNADDLINEMQTIEPSINQLTVDGITAQKISNYPNSVMKITAMLNDLNTTGFATYLK